MSGIKNDYANLKQNLQDVSYMKIQMESRPGEEYDPKEILLRLNTYMDCGVSVIYRKMFGTTYYDLDTKRSCSNNCKTRMLIVFNEVECPSDTVKIQDPTGGGVFSFTTADLTNSR